MQTGPVVNGASGIDGACHYLSVGISRSAPSPSEALHHLQQAYLWAGVTALRGEREREREVQGGEAEIEKE